MFSLRRNHILPSFLITAGPTREYIDPVRYLSNASTGKMGYALADAARRMGCPVILVTGPVGLKPPRGVACVPVVSAREMFAAVKKNLSRADIVIGAAAVADYRPASARRHKIKKSGRAMTLRLVPNPDILAYAGRRKGRRVIVGFALESRRLKNEALRKMKEKDLDMIVGNGPSSIGSDMTTVHLFHRAGKATVIRHAGKNAVARRIVHESVTLYRNTAADRVLAGR